MLHKVEEGRWLASSQIEGVCHLSIDLGPGMGDRSKSSIEASQRHQSQLSPAPLLFHVRYVLGSLLT